MRAYGLDLPEYPWETLVPYRKLAAEHPGGTIDLRSEERRVGKECRG